MKKEKDTTNKMREPLGTRVRRTLASSATGRFFCGYGGTCEALRQSQASRALRKKLEARRLRMARWTAVLEDAAPLRVLRNFLLSIQMTSLRALSLALAPPALVTVLRCLLLPLFSDRFPLLTAEGICGGVLCFIALLFATIKAPLCRAVCDDPLLSRLLFDGLGARRPHPSGAPPLPVWFLAAIGGIFALLFWFVSPLLLTGILGVFLFIALSLASPEFCLTVTALAFPFTPLLPAPTLTLCLAVGLGVLSYLRKVALGKRQFFFEPLDLFVLIFAAFVLCGGLFALGSQDGAAKEALARACLMVGGYFLTANLLSTKRTLFLFLRALLISASLLAVIGLYQEITGLAKPDWLDSGAATYINGRITATLENPNMFAAYLILFFPLVPAMLHESEPKKERGWFFLALPLLFAALIFTWSRGAWVGLFAGLILYLLLTVRAPVRWCLALFAAVPNLLLFAPEALARRISSIFAVFGGGADSTVFYRFQIWRASLALFRDHLLGGIGVSSENFSRIYATYAVMGAEEAVHTHNLYLQIGVEMGIFALIAFLLLLIFAAQKCTSARFARKEGRFRTLGAGSFCGIAALLVFGVSDYVFFNLRVFFLFWLILGVFTAAGRADGEDTWARGAALHKTHAAAAEVRLK